VYLTFLPFRRRFIQGYGRPATNRLPRLRVLGVLLLGFSFNACLGSRQAIPRDDAPVPARADSLERAERSVVSLEPGAQHYRITITTNSAESGAADSARRNRTVQRGEFRAALRSEPPYGFSLQLTALRASIDSTSNQKPTELETRNIQPVGLSFDSTGRRSFLIPLAKVEGEDRCMPGVSPLSPLLARLLVLSPLITARRQQESLSDSLHYSSCAGGVRIRTITQITTSPVVAALPDTYSANIRGVLMADSTHSLPMQLQGSFTGSATITADTSRLGWVRSLEMSITLELTAASSLKEQKFTQIVRTFVTSY
jgi:hypothetical protein